LSFNAAKDTFGGSLKTLSANKDEAFRLFSLAITAPRFDDEPVERIRNQILVGLNRKLANPNSLAGRAWFKAAFGEHSYANPTMGTIATMKTLTPADLRQFKEKQIAQDNMVISVIGDLSASELGSLLDKTFGAVSARSNLAVPADVDRVKGPLPEVIPQDIPQSVVIFGGNGVKRDDPDYYAAYVLNYILGGGGFESRLTKEIREKRGLVYSVYSYLSPFQRVGLQLGGFGTSNASVAEAIDLLKAELVKIRTSGVTAEELDAAKKYLNGSFPLRLSSNSRIANIMVSMQLFDLPVSYLDERPELINKVTLEDVLRVANRLMDPDELIIIIVGKPAGVEPTN
ncbi:MAG: insulinase family protein, partial [Sneathiella sp.]|nr:insulinase family protein [Sneathiella sp.]